MWPSRPNTSWKHWTFKIRFQAVLFIEKSCNTNWNTTWNCHKKQKIIFQVHSWGYKLQHTKPTAYVLFVFHPISLGNLYFYLLFHSCCAQYSLYILRTTTFNLSWIHKTPCDIHFTFIIFFHILSTQLLFSVVFSGFYHTLLHYKSSIFLRSKIGILDKHRHDRQINWCRFVNIVQDWLESWVQVFRGKKEVSHPLSMMSHRLFS